MRAYWRSCAWLLWGLCCVPAGVQAHAHLLASEPPAQAVIDQTPQLLRLKFSEPVEKKWTRIDVKAGAETLNLSSADFQWDAAGKAVQVTLPKHVPSLTYQVEWSVLAKDGHPSKGRLNFKVKPQ